MMSAGSICSSGSIGDKASRIMKEIAPLRSKEAPSTRELRNYDEEKQKRQIGSVLRSWELNALYFGTGLGKKFGFLGIVLNPRPY
jgi:hypothetical protein